MMAFLFLCRGAEEGEEERVRQARHLCGEASCPPVQEPSGKTKNKIVRDTRRHSETLRVPA